MLCGPSPPPPLHTPSSSILVPQCSMVLQNSTLQSGTGMWVRWQIWMGVSLFVYVIMCIIHNVMLTKSSSAHYILIHTHPQCLTMLKYSPLQSGTGMWVGWLICTGVSIFVNLIMCNIHVCMSWTPLYYLLTSCLLYMIFCYILIRMWFSPSSSSVIIHSVSQCWRIQLSNRGLGCE